MAYESLLNVTPAIASVNSYTYSSVTSCVSANILLNINNTTLGNSLTDNVLYLTIATNATSSAILSLSSASVIPSTIIYTGSVVSSTFNTAVSSVTLNINFPVSNDIDNVNLLTTNLFLSGNSSTIVFDTTQNSKLDNFFFVSTNPSETSSNSSNAVRTTAGHARLVAQRG
jgi:hypothetical protein